MVTYDEGFFVYVPPTILIHVTVSIYDVFIEIILKICIFLQKNLVMSKKSSTFAKFFLHIAKLGFICLRTYIRRS